VRQAFHLYGYIFIYWYSFSGRGCASGCLNTVEGKIVVCDVPNNVMEQKAAGAVGTILHVTDVDTPGLGPIAVATLDDTNYEELRSYVLSSP